jgi:glutathione-regulated potassium-efflux system ancillary protein KefC/glutathione-regulated potassium-efflux system protein KefB
MFVLAIAGKFAPADAQGISAALAQGGEFAFVLFSAATLVGVLSAETRELLVMVVTASMVFAVPFMLLHERLLAAVNARRVARDYDRIDAPPAPVIIAGYGRFGQIVSRVLRMCDIPFTALEASYAQVDFVRRYGNRIYYGDASRVELLHAAKAGEARLFVLAIDDVEASVKTAAIVRKHFPHLEILARARNRVHYFRLRDLGVRAIYRETFPASLEVAHQALLKLGFGVAAAQRAIFVFREHDEGQLQAQYAVHHDEAQIIQTAQQAAEQLRELFEADMRERPRGFPEREHTIAADVDRQSAPSGP